MKRLIFCFAAVLAFLPGYSSTDSWPYSGRVDERKFVSFNTTGVYSYIHDPELFNGWNTLAQPGFWRRVIDLTEDSAVVNIPVERKILGVVSTKDWNSKSEIQKGLFKDSIRKQFGYSDSTSIYITVGKKEFYTYKMVIPTIGNAIRVFSAENTDPWFAQVILLIESPGKIQKSSVGAYGPFQLMKGVARKFGLVVNKYVDEREDFNKSAMAAARLISRICIPETRKILNAHNIEFKESDLWFRLMVLHTYHAGAGNVAKVINKINPTEGGMPLILEMWRTECGGFRNASQNYTQIGLASLLRFEDLVGTSDDTVYLLEGDRLYNSYKSGNLTSQDSIMFLRTALRFYKEDLLHGIVPSTHFIEKIEMMQKEYVTVCDQFACRREEKERLLATYDADDEEEMDALARKLIKMRRFQDAVEVYKFNVSHFPNSWKAYSGLAEAYRLSGNKELAITYSKKAQYLNP
jgi:tetratricopeptide (TPR) repeat protein